MSSLKVRKIQIVPKKGKPLRFERPLKPKVVDRVFTTKTLQRLWDTHLRVPASLLINHAEKLRKGDTTAKDQKQLANLLDSLVFRLFRLAPKSNRDLNEEAELDQKIG